MGRRPGDFAHPRIVKREEARSPNATPAPKEPLIKSRF
jgi:hypothetical protein